MTVVAPSADPRQIAEALNDFSQRFSGGIVTLGAGTSTVVHDPRVGPRSLVFVTAELSGTTLTGATAGEGFFTIQHSGSLEGRVVGYFSFNIV